MEPEVRENVTIYFFAAWAEDLAGDERARDHYLTRAFRTIVHAGYALIV